MRPVSLIYRMATFYMETDDGSSIRKQESAARLKPWGLQAFSAIIPSEFSHPPFFEQPGLTAWLHPGRQNTIPQTRHCFFPNTL
jgi:hypothetical protein